MLRPTMEQLNDRIRANAVIPDVSGRDVDLTADLRSLHPMLAMHVARIAVFGGATEEIGIVQSIIDDHVADNSVTSDT